MLGLVKECIFCLSVDSFDVCRLNVLNFFVFFGDYLSLMMKYVFRLRIFLFCNGYSCSWEFLWGVCEE